MGSFYNRHMGNDINKKNKGRSNISGSAVAAIGGIAAVCFCVLFVVFRAAGVGAYTESEESKNGAVYISGIQDRDVKDITNKIGMSSKQQSSGKAEEKLAALDDEETDIWSLFDGIVIVGDSRAESFVEYGFLPESTVVAKKGANLKYADELISDVVAKQPEKIIFSYGINDVDGNWISAEAFKERYKEIIDMYKQELPNSDIYICSIVPVTESAKEEDSNFYELPEYAAAVEDMCEEEGYVFIDCDGLFDYTEYHGSDGIHFQAAMYPIWGEMMLRKVFEYESGREPESSDQHN